MYPLFLKMDLVSSAFSLVIISTWLESASDKTPLANPTLFMAEVLKLQTSVVSGPENINRMLSIQRSLESSLESFRRNNGMTSQTMDCVCSFPTTAACHRLRGRVLQFLARAYLRRTSRLTGGKGKSGKPAKPIRPIDAIYSQGSTLDHAFSSIVHRASPRAHRGLEIDLRFFV